MTGTLASNGLACELAQDLLASSMREESAGIESVTCNLNSSVVLGCASLEKQADIASYLANIEHTIQIQSLPDGICGRLCSCCPAIAKQAVQIKN